MFPAECRPVNKTLGAWDVAARAGHSFPDARNLFLLPAPAKPKITLRPARVRPPFL
jgi:hypothetical protein